MHKLTDISSAEQSGTGSTFTVRETEPFQLLEATGEMEADRTTGAFLYRLSTGKKAVYIRFGKEFWPDMARTLHQELLPVLVWGNQTVPLQRFQEELRRLTGSPGTDEFAEAVRAAFPESAAARRQDM
ncbi:hypothetical protein [Indiicoccus explosivorum]|uniref:UPF0738 family protein n=1 Tax=Indiicoccus explosivorum TaxID=1917864 RepID=UPI000B4529F5|nr:hypothetical protein [Indiicoccus explosivorum]